MDTLTFLRHILPSQGVYVFSVIRPHPTEPRKSTANSACASIEALAARIQAADRNPIFNVYHACASFEDGTLPPNKGLRKADNAAWVRSQWIDIDVDPENPKKYPDKGTAIKALTGFCVQNRLNSPLLVASGGGLHAYWVFKEDVPADQARVSSRAFKRALEAAGIKTDHTRTADLSSVLRPPGTHWRKDGEIEVEVLFTGKPVGYAGFCSRFAAFAEAPKAVAEDDEFSTGPREFPPSSAVEIVKHCAAIREVRDCGGADVPEPLWRATLGLLKHTVEGGAIAHEWSQGDARYSREETQTKLDRWTSGPPTCTTIRNAGGACGDCPHQCKSPISLGLCEAPPAPVEHPAPHDEPPPAVDPHLFLNKLPAELAALGAWNNEYQYLSNAGTLGKIVPDPDGGPSIHVPFVLKYVYPYTYIRREDGTYEIGFCAYTKASNTWDQFAVPAEYLSDLRRLGGALAARKVYATGKGGLEMLKSFVLDLLSNHVEANNIEARQVGHFGWTEDGFVIGDTLITKDGDRPVMLGDGVPKNLKEGLETKGTVTDAVASLLNLYNRPGAEMMQFVLLSAFASPLIRLMNAELFHGIPVGLTGASGQGKTTLAMMACSIYGRPRSMLLNASDMGTTTNAMIQTNAVATNLPLIFDELHAMKEADLPTLLYALSNGAPKVALKQDRTFNETGARWDNVTFVTSNTNISAELANQERNKAEATQLRLWEIDIQHGELERVFDTSRSKAMIEHHLANYYGAIGRDWVRYVVKRRERITVSLLKARAKYVPNTQEMNRERFFYDLLTAVMVAGAYAKSRFGLTFDLLAIEKWAVKHIRKMRELRQHNLASYPEQLAAVVHATAGRTVVSKAFPRTRQNEKEVVDERLVDPIARYCVQDGVLLITWPGFSDICRNAKINPNGLLEELSRHGLLKDPAWIGLDKRGRVAMFRGTTLPSAYTQPRVIGIDLQAARAMDIGVDVEPEESNVVKLRRA